MKRKSLIGLIVVVAAMSLAALTVGQALWTDQLTARGSVETGTMYLKFGPPVVTADNNDVGTCTAAISNDKLMSFTLHNAYPGYKCMVDVAITNTGSVPAELTGVTTWDDGGMLVPYYTFDNLQPAVGQTDLTQIGAGDTITAHFQIGVSPTVNVDQNTTYQRSFVLDFENWYPGFPGSPA